MRFIKQHVHPFYFCDYYKSFFDFLGSLSTISGNIIIDNYMQPPVNHSLDSMAHLPGMMLIKFIEICLIDLRFLKFCLAGFNFNIAKSSLL
ncbi:hypothetical protein KFK09_009168 [Dendrobium nobile]|uniref:Uncharacterized protein n=1 Tax=Dendrobium nobile TaxID=94219 RepID=A0A8T3BRI0_DENNO|nr:hypothetical protein KFK09_009168 [Dendrobium nobile]